MKKTNFLTLKAMFARSMLILPLAFVEAAPVSAESVSSIALASDLNAAITSTQEALTALKTNDSESCQSSIREAKQHYKLLVGDFSDMPARDDPIGKSLDTAMRNFKQTRVICAQSNLASSTQKMEEVIELLERFHKRIKRS
jgi:hypothetical protein